MEGSGDKAPQIDIEDAAVVCSFCSPSVADSTEAKGGAAATEQVQEGRA